MSMEYPIVVSKPYFSVTITLLLSLRIMSENPANGLKNVKLFTRCPHLITKSTFPHFSVSEEIFYTFSQMKGFPQIKLYFILPHWEFHRFVLLWPLLITFFDDLLTHFHYHIISKSKQLLIVFSCLLSGNSSLFTVNSCFCLAYFTYKKGRFFIFVFCLFLCVECSRTSMENSPLTKHYQSWNTLCSFHWRFQQCYSLSKFINLFDTGDYDPCWFLVMKWFTLLWDTLHGSRLTGWGSC